jgi:PAS domain S-box-containing protein
MNNQLKTDPDGTGFAPPKSEGEYRLLFEANPQPMYVCDQETLKFLAVNDAAVRHYGYSRKEFLGMSITDIRPPEDVPVLLNRLATTTERSHNSAGIWRHQKKDGTLIEVEVTWHKLDFAGRPSYLVLANDITSRRQAEVALRESEERYRELFENANDLIYTHDLTGNFTSLNKSGEQLTGYTQEEACTMNIARVVAPEHLKTARGMIARKTVEANVPTVYELDIIAKNGRRISLELSTRLIYEDGQPFGVQGIGRDITERKRTEEALRESEQKFRSIVETTNEWVWSIDVQGNHTYSNPAIEGILGFTPEEIVGTNSLALMHEDDSRKVERMLPELIGQGLGWNGLVLRWKHKRGGYRYLESNGVPVFDPQGNLIGYRGTDRDITVRRRMEVERQMIFEIIQGVITTPTLDDLLKLIHHSISKLLYAENCFVALHDPATNWLHFEFWRDQYDPEPSPRPVGKKGFASYVLQTGKPLLLTRELTNQMIERGEVENSGTFSASWLGVPLRTPSRTLGVLVVQHYENENAYSDQDLELLTSVGSQIALAIERKRAESQLQQQAERVALTNRISQAVRRSLDVSEIFETAVGELGAHLGVDRCSLFVIDRKAGRATNVAEYDAPGVDPTGREFELPQLESLIAAVQEHGVCAFDDVTNDRDLENIYECTLQPFNVRSIMYVGVSVRDTLFGAFALSTTKQLRRWDEADIELARAVADQTGMALRQAKLYEKAEATSVRESLANKLSLAIRASLSLTDVLDTATRELGMALYASRVQVRLCDVASRESAVVHEYQSADCADIRQAEHSYDDHLRRNFLRSPKPLVIDDAQHYSAASPELNDFIRAHALRTGVSSELDYPLTVSGQYRGVISIHQAGGIRRWTEDEVTLVELVAMQLATGIAQAELFQLVERGKKDWESTFDAMSDGIFIFDRAGRLMRVNRAGAAMEHTTPDMMLGRKCCEILRAGSSNTCVVEQAVRHSKSVTVEVVPELLNRPLLVSAEPVLDRSGKTSGVVCTARDLSELREVEAVARERQTLLRNILDGAREAIYALDTEGRYQWCNQAMLDLTGYKPEELIGRPFLERTHEDDRAMRRERFAAVLAGEAQSFESRYTANDGSVRYALVNNAPIVVDGRITGVLGIARDVTEQKQERERASRADKLRALGQLASGVAHDFNNSLAAILGRAQLMQRQLRDDALLRNLSIIVTAAEDAAATVRRIQTFARKSQIKESELLDVGNLLHDAFEITRTRWQNEARAAGISIEVKLNTDAELFTHGNASELREVFVNLIVNAVDAMPQGGQLKICAKRKGDRLRLRFADTGTGMTEEVREHIFEPFYTTKGLHGTGLGLAVSYGIIEQHQGTISVESALGKGTKLVIHLPAAEPEEVVRAADPDPVMTQSLSVLVIDDEPVVRDTLAAMLVDLDHRVDTADGGREGLEKLANADFDLVFTDLAMPEMDGWETAREIRKRRPELPVVLVTGYGATTTPPESEPDLIADIIGKPFDFQQVTGTLAKLCNSSDARA